MPTQLTTGDLVTAANWNTIPIGVLGYAQVTADQTGITSLVDLTGLSVTVTPLANRRVKVSAFMNILSTVKDDLATLVIVEDSTIISQAYWVETVATFQGFIACQVVVTPTAASHTFKLQLGRVSGTGSLSVKASTTIPASILVEDIGPV